jgi:hypothetical protein
VIRPSSVGFDPQLRDSWTNLSRTYINHSKK